MGFSEVAHLKKLAKNPAGILDRVGTITPELYYDLVPRDSKNCKEFMASYIVLIYLHIDDKHMDEDKVRSGIPLKRIDVTGCDRIW